ncbi:MAG: NosD domain-containing protein [Candidatus Thorarchaeota archaeon]
MSKSNIKRILVTLVVCMLLALIPSLTSFSNYGYFNSESVSVENANLTLAYTSHSPFNITSNSDFETQSWPGEGTSMNPYLISGLNITSPSPVCILIANTTSYFTITECLFSSQENDWGQGIITIENVIHGLVEDNEFAAGYIAISVEDSSSCSFVGNTIGTSLMGFLAYNLNNSEFSGNTQTSESIGYPVHIEDGNNLIIRSNSFQNCAYEGIGLTSCTDCILEYNVITGLDLHLGQYGFAIRNSRQCTLVRNNVTGCGTGIDITNGVLHTISDNYIQQCFGGISLRGNNTIINDNEIFSLGYCVSLIGSFRNVVQSNELQSTSQGNGIQVDGGANSNITENIFNQHDSGVRIQGTTNLRVSNNNFSNCFAAVILEDNAYIGQDGPPIDCKIIDNNFGDSGIRFSISNPAFMDHEISGNLVNGRQYAYLYEATNMDIDGRNYGRIILVSCEDVSITGGLLDELLVMFSSNCEISGVSIVNRTDGIYVRYSDQIVIGYSEIVGNDVGVRIEWSNFCLVIRTTTYNNGHGILLDSSLSSTVYDCDIYDNEYGMVLIGAHQSNIESNRIYRNTQGIYLLRSEESYIGNNDVLENYETGLLLNRGSRFNRIIANSFGWNSVNAMCSGFDNVWDDGVNSGNKWSDLGGAIVYVIDEDDTDRYPSLLGDGSTTTLPVSTNNGTSNAVESEIGILVVSAVTGFGLLGLFAVAVSFAKRRN